MCLYWDLWLLIAVFGILASLRSLLKTRETKTLLPCCLGETVEILKRSHLWFFFLPVGPSLNIDSSVKVFCAVSPHDTIISRGLLKISFKVIIMSVAPLGRPVSVTHWSVRLWYLWMNFIGVGEDTALRENLLNASELLSFAADFTSGGLRINQRNESLLCFAVSHCTSHN